MQEGHVHDVHLLHYIHERPYDVEGKWENDGGVFLHGDIRERLQVAQLERTWL